MNELLTNIIIEKPANVKEYIAEQLKAVKKRQIGDKPSDFIWEFPSQILTQEDFEAMFNAYDIMNLHYIPTSYLIDGLNSIGVPDAEQLVKTKYMDSIEEG